MDFCNCDGRDTKASMLFVFLFCKASCKADLNCWQPCLAMHAYTITGYPARCICIAFPLF